ncbi:transglutaminase family protein [Flammeovirgaceae bacterium SG7u.111]|nr:transglutaminase family protein [Flammeovirgaceae bacterium SG7u.132]WPO37421.1 transglutaminase family protein [Flammeovirgaceae bacterium SG7u.111]
METKLKIVHETVYEFTNEVFIEPHYLRFKPRVTSYNKLESIDFKIFPTPISLSEQSDAENNSVYFCQFDGLHMMVSFRSISVVTLWENNPFNFGLFPIENYDLPLQYDPQTQMILHAALLPYNISNSLIDFGNTVLANSNNKTLDFLVNLTNRIYADFTGETRLVGEPNSPETTLQRGKGSCRDLAWMQIHLLRYFGIAARFVSGYYFTNAGHTPYELHAWVEVYLPGAGWVGFDPSNGILAGSSHIPVCSSAHYQHTMPITGTYRGAPNTNMETSLLIEKI